MAQEPKQAPPCPICAKPAAAGHKPFCSKRCADVDLHRWMKGAYVIAGEAIDDESLSSPAIERVGEAAKN
jgi:endogenous inhibitor of DNA gyrase (YacG/DUF329 family)